MLINEFLGSIADDKYFFSNPNEVIGETNFKRGKGNKLVAIFLIFVFKEPENLKGAVIYKIQSAI